MTETKSPRGLRNEEKLLIIAIYAVISVACLAGVLGFAAVGKSSALMAGLVIVAFTFGLRHGMDADHIAAIDNVTRKLIREGKRPLTVGTWFSLGHSTVVMLMIVALVVATNSVVGAIPFLQSIGAALGRAIAGSFLWIIGLMNLAIVFGLYRVFRDLGKKGTIGDEFEGITENGGGFLSRYSRSLFRLISEPWKAYFLG